MTKILIPHGITPTGVGLRLRTNGTLRPISPCCGRSMVAPTSSCRGCSRGYLPLEGKIQGSLSNDIRIFSDTSSREIVIDWIRNITGIPNLEAEFE